MDAILEMCSSDLKTVVDFKNFIKIVNVYHFKRCTKENCPYCSFLQGLFIIYCETVQLNVNSIERLTF